MMASNIAEFELPPTKLLAVITLQTEIARLGLDLQGVMTLVADRARLLTDASGGVVELAEGDYMVYRAVAGETPGPLGLKIRRDASLSGRCVAAAIPLCCHDSECDDRVDRDACRRVNLRSMIVVPLIHQ